MTREDRAKSAIAAVTVDGWREGELWSDEVLDLMLAFADAEAAAMRERAADRFKQAVQADYPDFDCVHEPEWQGCIACYDVALLAAVDEVRDLPAKGEE